MSSKEGPDPRKPGLNNQSGLSSRAGRVMERAELYLYTATSFILIITAAGLLAVAVVEMVRYALAGNFLDALLHVLDRALLVLMLAEIIYTVRRIAHRRRLEVHPFFVVAIIAAIRRMLVITAESSSSVDLQDPYFQAAMLELGLLAIIIVALAFAMRMIPREPDD
jgi:uncharacterized membrane protein (DUF373 family)